MLGGHAAASTRDSTVIGLIRRLLAVFRRLRRSLSGDTTASSMSEPEAIPLEPNDASHRTPSHPLQSAPNAFEVLPQSFPVREVGSRGDDAADTIHTASISDVCKNAFATSDSEPAPPAPPANDLADLDATSPVVHEAAVMGETGLAARGDNLAALPSAADGTGDVGDQPISGTHSHPDGDIVAAYQGGQDLFDRPSMAVTEVGAIQDRASSHPSSEAPVSELAAEPVMAGLPAVPRRSVPQAPPDQIVASIDALDSLAADASVSTPEAIRAEGIELAKGPSLIAKNGSSSDDTDMCAESAADEATPDAVCTFNGGTAGTGTAPDKVEEPDKQCETELGQSAADNGPEDVVLEPVILAKADPESSQPTATWANDGKASGEPSESGEGTEPDGAVDCAHGAADVLALPINAADFDNAATELGAANPNEPAAAADADGAELPNAVEAVVWRRPGEYRPRLNRARTRRAPAVSQAAGGDVQNLGADLLVLIGAANWGVELTALLRTPADAKDDVVVDHGGVETWLGQLDDELLEPLPLTDASAAFGEPLLVTAIGLPVRWSRTSRDLHVFGPHPRVAGFVSQPRVVIGQESVVICREGLAGAARAQILATGSTDPLQIEGPNVPEGWVCWRGVRPVRPSIPSGGQSILDALDPLPAISIELSGGIQLSRGVWLEGHPPSIRLLGLLSEGDPVLLDGQPASRDGDGAWTVEGWDAPGAHVIDHGGKSASYAVEPGSSAWDWWIAWGGATRLAGALSDADSREYFHSATSAVLIGSRPGQICGFVHSAFGIGVARPDFEPVWLLTTASGMRRGSVSMIGLAPPPGTPVGSHAAVERWVQAVRSIGRAGADRSEERTAWSGYIAVARSHRKRRK